MRLARIGDEFGFHANGLAELHQFLALGEGNIMIRIAMQVDQGRQMLDVGHHCVRHTAVQHRQRGNAGISHRGIGRDVTAQREAEHADMARAV